MKRFIVLTVLLSVSILAAWVIFGPSIATQSETRSENPPIKAQDAANEMQKANQPADLAASVAGTDMEIAPVFDNTGRIVSDPTGTLLSANHSGDMALPLTADMMIAPAFDSTGAVVSDPSGTLLSAAVLATADMKVAPVFDSTGRIVSDPTGTILSVINP